MNAEVKKPAVLITGGTGGLGASLANYMLSRGWRVVVADIDRQALLGWQDKADVLAVQLDVCDSASTQAAAETVRTQWTQLDAIVNFAGIHTMGALLEMDEARMRRIIDINLLGTFRVNQAFFPLVKRTGQAASSGRIVTISSETGWQSPAPFNAPYGVSKHAVDAYAQALRREMQLLGMYAINIQPGPFDTGMVGRLPVSFRQAADESLLLGHYIRSMEQIANETQHQSHAPEYLSSVIYHALTTRKPKANYSVRPDAKRRFLSHLPESWQDAIYAYILKRATTAPKA